MPHGAPFEQVYNSTNENVQEKRLKFIIPRVSHDYKSTVLRKRRGCSRWEMQIRSRNNVWACKLSGKVGRSRARCKPRANRRETCTRPCDNNFLQRRRIVVSSDDNVRYLKKFQPRLGTWSACLAGIFSQIGMERNLTRVYISLHSRIRVMDSKLQSARRKVGETSVPIRSIRRGWPNFPPPVISKINLESSGNGDEGINEFLRSSAPQPFVEPFSGF